MSHANITNFFNIHRKISLYKPKSRAATEKERSVLTKALCETYKRRYHDIPASPFFPNERFPVTDLCAEVPVLEGRQETEQTDDNRGNRKTLSYENIFKRNDQWLKNIFIYGKAGTGKTTWCYQLVSRWVQIHDPTTQSDGSSLSADAAVVLKSLKYVFYVPLRHVQGKSLCEAICSYTLANYDQKTQDIAKRVFESNPEEVLVICDGLDEYDGFPSRENLHGCTVLTTTRPWKLFEAKKEEEKLDLVLMLGEMGEQGVRSLTENLLRVCYHKQNIEKETDRCIQAFTSAGFYGLAKVPLLLNFIVHLWNEQKQLSISITKNSLRILELVVIIGEEKFPREKSLKEIQLVEGEEDKCLREKVVRGMRLADCSFGDLDENFTEVIRYLKDYCDAFEDYCGLFLVLGRLAFESLLLKEKTENALVFRRGQLQKYFNALGQNASRAIKFCFASGMLYRDDASTRTREQFVVGFPHKLIQEFFAALWLAVCPLALQTFEEKCKSVDQILNLSNIIIFLSGISNKISSLISQHIVEQEQVLLEKSELKLCLISDIFSKCLLELRGNGQKLHVLVGPKIPHSRLHTENTNALIDSDKTVVRILNIKIDKQPCNMSEVVKILSKLKKSMRELSVLRLMDLWLGWNQWCDVLESIEKCLSLKILKLHHIEAKDTRATPNTVHLNLSSLSQISDLCLTHLKFSSNDWDSILQCISRLLSLKVLNLGVISLTDSGKDGDCNLKFSKLENLRELTIGKDLPGSLLNIDFPERSALRSLSLNLSGFTIACSYWSKALKCIEMMKSLKVIKLSDIREYDESPVRGQMTLNLSDLEQLTDLEFHSVALPLPSWDSLLSSMNETRCLERISLKNIRLSDHPSLPLPLPLPLPLLQINMDLSRSEALKKLEITSVILPGSSMNITLPMQSQLARMELSGIQMSSLVWQSIVRAIEGIQSLTKLVLRDITLTDMGPSERLELNLSALSNLQETSQIENVPNVDTVWPQHYQ